MLLEIRCDEFISYDKPRGPIQFHDGLNTVLGSETADNSIGKSTFLMIVDFVFGGDDYVLKSTDVQKQVGPHTIKFAFRFNKKIYRFSRDTINHTIIHCCDEEYLPITDKDMTSEAFRIFLLKQYNVNLPFITFRDIVGRYFRIYGRGNLDEKHPLHTVQAEPPKKAITALMMLFNQYTALKGLEEAAEKSKKERDAFKNAQAFKFIPKVGRRQFANNEKRVKELQVELVQIQTITGNELMGIESQDAEILAELKRKLASAKRQRSRLKTHLVSVENDLVSDKSKNIIPPNHARIQELLNFFPNVNLKKIEDIEQFHNQLVMVLNIELEEAKQQYIRMIALADDEIRFLEQRIRDSGLSPLVSRTILESYAVKKSQIGAIERENETYRLLDDLVNTEKAMKARLLALQEEQIGFLQNTINVTMDRINDVVYQGEKKAPVLTIKKPNSYTFLTPDDTGTGTSYKGLVVFDLAILQLTDLPTLAHDSVILKQIADAPLEQILYLYSSSKKQVFISLDKKGSYSENTQKILEATMVLQLSAGGNELFGRSWNSK